MPGSRITLAIAVFVLAGATVVPGAALAQTSTSSTGESITPASPAPSLPGGSAGEPQRSTGNPQEPGAGKVTPNSSGGGITCQLVVATVYLGAEEMDYDAVVSCNGPHPGGAEVQECPQILSVSGSWVTESGNCRTNTDGAVNWIEAYIDKSCQYGRTYRTWGWDYLPGFTPGSVVNTSGPTVCK